MQGSPTQEAGKAPALSGRRGEAANGREYLHPHSLPPPWGASKRKTGALLSISSSSTATAKDHGGRPAGDGCHCNPIPGYPPFVRLLLFLLNGLEVLLPQCSLPDQLRRGKEVLGAVGHVCTCWHTGESPKQTKD